MIQVRILNKKVSSPSEVSVTQFDSVEDAELFASQNRDETYHAIVEIH
jgi:hypothetical protein